MNGSNAEQMNWMIRILNLRPGDFRRGLPLFAYYFLIISSYVLGQVARDALFLDRFTAVQLPYADIAIAALVGFVVAFYIRIGRRATLRNLLVASLLFFASNVVLAWWAVHYHRWPWLYPVLYVWVGIFGALASAQVWTLANFVWTTREAKRLFGLLGSGGIAGGIFGGFFSTWMASAYGTESLLLVVAAFLVMCAGLVILIWRQRQPGAEETAGSAEAAAAALESPRNLFDSFRIVRRSPHLLAIAALILLSSIVTTAAGWQLKAIAKETLVAKDALAAFLGSFYGYTGIASLAAQLLITSKLLRRFGIGVALLVLPMALVGGSVAVIMAGSLWAVSLLKGSDKVFRYSIDTSALQLLYLPVPSHVKLQVKSFIDTVVWRFGDGLAGLTLLVFATYLNFTPSQISWVGLVLLGGWIAAAYAARQQYMITLNENIQHVRIKPDAASLPTLDRFTTKVLAAKLNSSDPNEILYALELFQMGRQHHAHSAVQNLLDHPSPHIRRKVIEIMNNAGDLTVRSRVASLLRDDDLEVRTEALMYLTRHDHIDPLAHIDELRDFADFSIQSATLAFLSRPGEAQNIEAARLIMDGMVGETGANGKRQRIEAARLIASLPDYFETQLGVLLGDAETEVAQHAAQAASVLRKRRYVPLLIGLLGKPDLAEDVADALAGFGDAVIGTLGDHLADPEEPIEIRREIPHVLFKIGTPAAAAVLVDNLLMSNTVLRFRVISALNKLHDLRRSLPLDRPLIETVMVAEIMGHYRSYQILGKLEDTSDNLLAESMNRELERIFRLVKLLYPSIDMQNAYLGVQSTNRATRANALEFLDNTLNPQLRSLLVPVIDSEVSLRERVQFADRLLGLSVNSHEEAVAVLASSEDPWLKSCAERWEQKFAASRLLNQP